MKTAFLTLLLAAPALAQTPAAPTSELEQLLAARPVLNQTLTGEAAVTIALRESPIVRGASQEVEIAQARIQAARAELRPAAVLSGFLTGGDSPSNVLPPIIGVPPQVVRVPEGSFLGGKLTAILPLYTGGRLKTLVNQARLLQNASQADLESQRQEIALLTRTTFREVQARRAIVAVQRDRLTANEEQLRLDRVRADEGKIPPFFVLRQEAEVAAAQQDLTNAQRDVELSLLQLKTVMGVSLSSNLEIVGDLEYAPSAEFIARLNGATSIAPTVEITAANGSNPAAITPAPDNSATVPATATPGATAPVAAPATPARDAATPPAPFPNVGAEVPPPALPSSTPTNSPVLSPDLSALLRTAQATRPELRASSARVSGAQLESGAIGSSYKPQINAFAMGDFGASGGNRNAGTTFGLVASIPVFTGGRKRASLDIADARRRQLESEREQLALEIAQSVQAAYLNLNAAEQNVTTARVALTAAREDYRVAQIRYQSGRSTIVDALDALASRTRAQSNLVQALFAYNVGRDTLLRAVGELVPPAN